MKKNKVVKGTNVETIKGNISLGTRQFGLGIIFAIVSPAFVIGTPNGNGTVIFALVSFLNFCFAGREFANAIEIYLLDFNKI